MMLIIKQQVMQLDQCVCYWLPVLFHLPMTTILWSLPPLPVRLPHEFPLLNFLLSLSCQVNFLSHWLLAHELLASQRQRRARAARKGHGCCAHGSSLSDGTRLVMLSSLTHHAGKLQWEDKQVLVQLLGAALEQPIAMKYKQTAGIN
jgi:hypothetical protein